MENGRRIIRIVGPPDPNRERLPGDVDSESRERERIGEIPAAVDQHEDNALKYFLEFIKIVKEDLPDRVCTKIPSSKLPSYMELIAKMMYVHDEHLLKIIRNDDPLALKLWQFVLDGTSTIIQDMLDKKRRLLNRPHVETVKLFEDHGEEVRVAFAAITNFIGADFACIPPKLYCSIVPQLLDKVWYQGSLDELKDISYTPLENLTVDKGRSEYLIEQKKLSLSKLMDRTRKYSFDSPQFSSLVAAIGNLCQVPSVMKELLESRLENETEVYLEHFLPALQLQHPEDVRGTISGMLKNLAMFPEAHPLLLDKNREFLSCALGPIVGKGEYSDEEMMDLPIALYGMLLNANEESRDPDLLVRCNTIDFVYQLCSTRSSREALREQNVYCILREYHKWETHEPFVYMIEQVVNILIQTEDEIGVDDLKALSLGS